LDTRSERQSGRGADQGKGGESGRQSGRQSGDQSGKQSGGQRVKSSHIISEFIDVGVPNSVAYAQWTQYDKWSDMFKKESAKAGNGRRTRSGSGNNDDPQTSVSSKIGPSQRQWKAEIVERRPDRRIVWKAKGGVQAKGVTSFHALDDRLTRLMVEVEYHPSGFLETIGNFFRMQRRRVRKDLKLFKNYIELKGEPTGEGPGPIRGDGWRDEVDEQVRHEQEG
jgi:uncharacterized membrane protein